MLVTEHKTTPSLSCCFLDIRSIKLCALVKLKFKNVFSTLSYSILFSMTNLKYEDSAAVVYFLSFLYGLILVPCTYLFWPTSNQKQNLIHSPPQCKCYGCVLKKRKLHGSNISRPVRLIKLLILFALWVIFIYIMYFTLSQEVNTILYDPWKALGVDQGNFLLCGCFGSLNYLIQDIPI